MALQEITALMSKLATLHESLLELSKQKTEFLKDGDTDGIQKTLVNEKKHIQAIQQLEEKRATLTEQWFKQVAPAVSDYTITAMIEHVENAADKEKLNGIYERLIMAIASLKQQEQLNADLTKQSLQFVELTMELLEPTIKNMNYGDQHTGKSSHSRSIFDSKA